MFLGGAWHTLEMTPAPAGTDPAGRLDVSRLHDLVLAPLLGIGDVRTDKRIDFVGGARGTGQLESLRVVGTRRRGVLDVSGQRRRPDADFGQRRHHAAEVDLVRTEAARRPAVACDLNHDGHDDDEGHELI